MAVVDMGIHSDGHPVSLYKISLRQNIALNYLEQIFMKLKRAGIVSSVRGPGGGYVLNGPLESLKLSSVISAVEGSFKMTRCSKNFKCTSTGGRCSTHAVWAGLGKAVFGYFDSISVQDVARSFSVEETQI